MSYILDALTKAAQQRDRGIPVVQRLLAPAARVPGPGWTRSFGRLFVALAVNAGLLTVLIFWWLQPFAEPPVSAPTVQVPATAPTEEPIRATAAAARSIVEPPRAALERALSAAAPPPPVAEPPRAVTAEGSRAAEPPRPAIAEPPAAAPRAEKPAPSRRSLAVAPPAPVVAPQAPAPVPLPMPQRPVPSPQSPPPIVSSPLNPVAPAVPPGPSRSTLKLEALIYSDVPSQRMVFINGRRYVQGDLVDGRLRVEEIHEDGVDLSEQGRRTTLRATR